MENRMEEFISSIISSSNAFIGGRTIAPGPAAAPTTGQGPVVLASHQQQGTVNPQVLAPRRTNVMLTSSAPPATSILHAEMSQMIAWLTSQNGGGATTDSPTFRAPSSSSEVYTSADYQKRIPKPYMELTERDCAGVVARAIRSIVLHTCNDQFRQQCFSKLGASNSRDVEREVNARLTALIEQEEQQTENDENQEMDTSSTTSPPAPPPPPPVFLNLNLQQ